MVVCEAAPFAEDSNFQAMGDVQVSLDQECLIKRTLNCLIGYLHHLCASVCQFLLVARAVANLQSQPGYICTRFGFVSLLLIALTES